MLFYGINVDRENVMKEYREYNSDNIKPPSVACDMYANRSLIAEYSSRDTGEVTIIIQAYHDSEKLKRCVDSVLRYTQNIDYNMVLIANGSESEVVDYFFSIPHEKKKIIRITNNCGILFPLLAVNILEDIGKYMCFLASDIICTPHWLDNLLICMKSDQKIGIVNPASNNAGLYQEKKLKYSNYEEMFAVAEKHNHSDPLKWEERLWFDALCTLYRKEAMLAVGWPLPDLGYYGYGADLDLCFSIRRAGYRLVFAGDTWVCHDDKHSHGKEAFNIEIQNACKAAWKGFEKKCGIKEKDVFNLYYPFFNRLPTPKYRKRIRLLGCEVKCGAPLLDFYNWLHRYKIPDIEISAVFEDPKYYPDLKSICDGELLCGQPEHKIAELKTDSYDYVVSDLPFNQYRDPLRLVEELFRVCKPKGYVVCKLRNVANFRNYAQMLGNKDAWNKKLSWDISRQNAIEMLSKFGTVSRVLPLYTTAFEGRKIILEKLKPRGINKESGDIYLEQAKSKDWDYQKKYDYFYKELLLSEPSERVWRKLVKQLLTQDYLFVVRKR